ncbi:MAG TPA: succinate dehydrogenase iron-sulfur subunit [Dehalococcoidia bacterium]|nr:succinate dehydrogenase iron-sulfur subunit [Dehalococcoidia bacterium]
MAQVQVKVLRYDPQRDAEPHHQDFTVEYVTATTILDTLVAIKEFQDGSLTFRRSCRQGICGSCPMRVNDRERLTCMTRVAEVIGDNGGELRIEPLANLPVLKDLAVDLKPFFDKYRAISPHIIHAATRELPEKEFRMSDERTTHLQQFGACIQCGACYSSCPIVATDDDYLGPAALAKAYRFANDPRDDGRTERLNLVGDEAGIWRCHTIFNCTEVCPKGVEPTYAIQQLKRMNVRKRLGFG